MPQMKKKSFIQKNGLIAVWTMAGFMAMGYIGFLATGTDSDNATKIDIVQNGGNAQISPVQRELAALRANIKELTSREKNTSRKLSLIEEALGPNTAALPEKPFVSDREKNTEPGTPLADIPVTTANVTINVLPLTQDDQIPELTYGKQSQRYGINLATALSIDSLRRHWTYLKDTNSRLIKHLKPHFIDKSTPDSPKYNLIIGPFDKLSEAQGHCQKLARASIECQETPFIIPSIQNIHTAGK